MKRVLMSAHGLRRGASLSFSSSLAMRSSQRHINTTGPASESPMYGSEKENTIVSVNRFSSWCKRLWQLSSSSSASFASRASCVSEDVDADAALLSMQGSLVADAAGRFPATLVEGIWETYDLVFPPRLSTSLKANVTEAEQNHFFAFLRILTEMHVNVDAVRQLSRRLEAELSALEATHSSGENEDTRLERVTQLCHDLQAVGAPWYYVWMRQSAALENGLRRLMDFRKTVHFFDVLCKGEIKTILKSRQQEQKQEPNASPLSASSSSLTLWQTRHHDVKRIDRALTNLFHDFFRKEYLVMEELTWYSTPPSLLEQIMAAESVQPFVNGLSDMKQRLQPTHHRHLFAFLHPSVVEEPLIAVQVALTKGVARSVDHLLSHPTPLLDPANQSYAAMRFKAYETSFQQDGGRSVLNEKVDSAIFYSINSAQSALRGMDMGNMLIKRVVREVEERVNTSRRVRGLETIRTFSTLSPIPGFVRWLANEVDTLVRQSESHARGDSAEVGAADAFAAPIFGTRSAARRKECCESLVTAVAHFMERHDVEASLRAAAQDPTSANTVAVKAVHAIVRQFLSSASPVTASSSSLAVVDVPVEADCTQERILLALRFLSVLCQHPELFPMTRVNTDAKTSESRMGWWWDPVFTTAMERPLLTSIAHYLYDVKKADGRIFDSVGNFHVSNGATLYRLNYLGNASAQGSRESACVMVNYWYDLPTISSNVLQYDTSHAVAVHTHITSLLEE